MKWLQPVIWSKGTYLTPQHLQLQDRFLESQLGFRVEALHFRPWGFRAIGLDHEQLEAGSVTLTEASGILPDGLPFDIPGSDPAPPAKSLEGIFAPDQDAVEIYLAIPEHRWSGLNVRYGEERGDARFSAEVAMLRDENTGLSERPIQVARKNFRLLAKTEIREGSVALPVARILRAPTGAYSADLNFVPPLIDFGASDYLVLLLRRQIEILSNKISQMSAARRQKNQGLADFTPSETLNFWLLHTLNSSFPVLNHLFAGRAGHPEQLYKEMLALAGALTTFSRDIHPRDLPAYDHDHLSICFTELDSKLRVLLETVVPTHYVALPLKFVKESLYATALEEDRYLESRMYLAIKSDASPADLIGRTPHLVKICSANHIEHLVRQALPGVPLVHSPVPPPSIPVKLNYQYFSLSQTGLAWEAIVRARNLAAYVPGDFPNPSMELVVLLPEKD